MEEVPSYLQAVFFAPETILQSNAFFCEAREAFKRVCYFVPSKELLHLLAPPCGHTHPSTCHSRMYSPTFGSLTVGESHTKMAGCLHENTHGGANGAAVNSCCKSWVLCHKISSLPACKIVHKDKLAQSTPQLWRSTDDYFALQNSRLSFIQVSNRNRHTQNRRTLPLGHNTQCWSSPKNNSN